MNDGEGLESWAARKARNIKKGINGNGMGTPLTIAAVAWSTPTAWDHKDGACAEADVPTNGLLGRQAARWMTPRAMDAESAPYTRDQGVKGKERLALGGQARLWPTMTVGDADKVPSRANFGQVLLANHPAIHGAPMREAYEKSRLGHPDQRAAPNGANTSMPSGRLLNPRFVEALMGLPIDWTVCASSAMVSSLSKPPTPSSHSLKTSPPSVSDLEVEDTTWRADPPPELE